MALPKDNLDDKYFDQFVKEALDRIPLYSSEWTDHNVHDPGIMLLELFAHLAEMQNYSANRITKEHFRKFVRLLGMDEKALPGRVNLMVEFDKTFSGHTLTLPAGTSYTALDPETGNRLEFVTEKPALLAKQTMTAVFRANPLTEVTADLDYQKTDSAGFLKDHYPFGPAPSANNALYMGFSPEDSKGFAGSLTLTVYMDNPGTAGKRENIHDNKSGMVAWEYYYEETGKPGIWLGFPDEALTDCTTGLLQSGKLVFDFSAVDHKPLPAALKGCPPEWAGKKCIWLRARCVRDGRIPIKIHSLYSNVVEAVCKTAGTAGNIQPGSVWNKIAGYPVKAVNSYPGFGGQDELSLEDAVYKARMDIRTLARAVTDSDYEKIVLDSPMVNVGRVKALAGYHPVKSMTIPGIMSIVVVPDIKSGRPAPDRDYLRILHEYLSPYKIMTTELFITGPEYYEIAVSATVTVKQAYLHKTVTEEVEQNIRDTLSAFLHPLEGGLEGTGWEFGRGIYRSELYELIEKIEGVDFVTHVGISTRKHGEAPWARVKGDFNLPPHSLVYSRAQGHDITIMGAKNE